MTKNKKLILWLAIAILVIVVLLFVKNIKDNNKVLMPATAIDPPTATNSKIPSSEPTEELPALVTEPDIELKQLGMFSDYSPYNFEMVEAILLSYGEQEPIHVTGLKQTYINQNLKQLNLDIAKADRTSHTSDTVNIHIQAASEYYELEYDLNLNAFNINGDWYYADFQVAEIMHSLYRPASILALIYNHTSSANAEVLQSEQMVNEDIRYDFSRFDVDGKDYNGWTLALDNEEPEVIVNFYNYYLDELDSIRYYKDLGILVSRELYFLDDSVETIDGIKVGLSRKEVIEKLGPPNYELTDRWSYQVGDYLKFHLYFDDDKVIFIKFIAPH